MVYGANKTFKCVKYNCKHSLKKEGVKKMKRKRKPTGKIQKLNIDMRPQLSG